MISDVAAVNFRSNPACAYPPGYTLIEVRSHDESLAWAQRFPAPFPGQPCCNEVHPLTGGIDLLPEDAERIIREQLTVIKQGR